MPQFFVVLYPLNHDFTVYKPSDPIWQGQCFALNVAVVVVCELHPDPIQHWLPRLCQSGC